MPEENEYEIEEGDITRFFFVTRMKDGKEFIVEQVHYSVSDTIQDNLYDKNGEPIMSSVGSHRKECREIRAVITKYLEKKEETIEIDNDLLRDKHDISLSVNKKHSKRLK